MDETFAGIKVLKFWGSEHEVFRNDLVSCWYLRIDRGRETSHHMHATKETGLILLNGDAHLTEGLNKSRPLRALDKSRFSRRFYHRTTAISACDLLEVETPANKFDVHRFKDSYGREGKPYESAESYAPLTDSDPVFDKLNTMRVGGAHLKIVEFVNGQAFANWARKLKAWQMLVILRGSLRSKQNIEVTAPGDVLWTHNLPDLLNMTVPDDDMQVITVWREDEARI
jgi:hypothetical protein